MVTITVKTGYGYFRNAAGHIISKSRLPAGDHPMQDGFTYTELANQASLDALQIWKDPAEADEAKITSRMRRIAIADLISTGELPAGYE